LNIEYRTSNIKYRKIQEGERRRNMTERKYDLEERLREYAAAIVKLTEAMPNTRAANHVGGQLLRSGASPLFNHGEAQAAESPNDFVHKMKICLKELRESQRALKLLKNSAAPRRCHQPGTSLPRNRRINPNLRRKPPHHPNQQTPRGPRKRLRILIHPHFDVQCWTFDVRCSFLFLPSPLRSRFS
jgi:four helix bundle protein